MEVQVKKRDYSSPVVHVFFSLVLLIASAVAIVISQTADITENGWFIYVLAGVFGVFGLSLLIQVFLPPKEFEAELVTKTEQDFKGNIITYMVFEPIIPNNPAKMKRICPCYTQTPNNLVVGKIYRIMVKTYNYKLVSILDPDKYKSAFVSEPSNQNSIFSSNRVSEDFTTDFAYKKLFYIKETGVEIMGKYVFYLTDDKDQVIYQFVKKLPNSLTWFVSDKDDNPVAQIEVNAIVDTRRITVNMENGKSFSVKPPIYVGDEFEVEGLDYTAREANLAGMKHITYFTKDGQLAGELNPEDALSEGKLMINKQVIKLNFNQMATPELLLLICCGRGMRSQH